MIKAKYSIISLLAASIFISCSNDIDDAQTKSSEYINSVRVTVDDFKPEAYVTRTAYTVDNTGFHFSWADGDALGIYPVGGDQVKFPISAGGGSKSATFDGGSWKLRSNFQYAAYYPFSTANYTIAQTALPVSYTGQTQNGNGSTAHVGAYDYLACAATQPNGSGGVDLQMKQLGAFLRLQLTMPKADTYSSVVLESDGAKFVTTGTFDLTAATPAITATATSSTFTINLTNVSTTAANQVVTVYALVAPANLIDANLKVTVHGAGQTTYVQTVAGKNFQAGYAYNIAVETFPSGTNASGQDVSWAEEIALTGTENGHEWVDLGLVDSQGRRVLWATMNVGAASLTETGHYYAWGETTYKVGIGSWYFQNTKYCYYDNSKSDATANQVSKYCLSTASANWHGTGNPDNISVLLAEDDAASVNWGGKWRTPTIEEAQLIYDNCSFTDIKSNNVDMIKITGPNGNYILIPYTSYVSSSGGSETAASRIGWSKTSNCRAYFATSCLDESGSFATKTFMLYYSSTLSSVVGSFDNWARCYGIPVRAVLTK